MDPNNMFDDFGAFQMFTKYGQRLPSLAEIMQTLARSRPNLATFGKTLANIFARFARQIHDFRQCWFRQLSSEPTKQRFAELLKTRFKSRRPFRSSWWSFLYLFWVGGSFGFTHYRIWTPRNLRAWIVCRSNLFCTTSSYNFCCMAESIWVGCIALATVATVMFTLVLQSNLYSLATAKFGFHFPLFMARGAFSSF